MILLLNQNTFSQTNYGVIDFQKIMESQSHKINEKLQNNINLIQLDDSLQLLTRKFYHFIEDGYYCTIIDTNSTLEYQDSIINTEMRIKKLYLFAQKVHSNLKLTIELDLKEEIKQKIETYKSHRNIKIIMD